MSQSYKDKLKNLSPEQIRKLMAARKGGAGENASPSELRMERNAAQEYPLSKAQERIWFLSQMSENGALYNIPVAIRFEERIQLNRLQEALQRMIEDNEILRTTFHMDKGRLFQKIHQASHFEVEFEDLRTLTSTEKEEKLNELAIEHASRSFQLEQLPLFGVKLLRLNEKQDVMLICLHHLISDGWTNMLLSMDASLYQGEVNHKKKNYSYIDFVAWEKKWLQSDKYKTDLQFWKDALDGYDKTVHFPREKRDSGSQYAGKLHTVQWPLTLTQEVNDFCSKENCTPFQFYFTCFSILTSQYTGEQDLIIGTPVANRNKSQFQDVYGLFFNSLPMRVEVKNSITFKEQLSSTIQRVGEYMKHQEVPFTEIIKTTNPNRNTDENALFNIHFAYQHFPKKNKEEEYAWLPIDYQSSKFDINFWMEVAGDQTKLSVTYKHGSVSKAVLERFTQQFEEIVKRAIHTPEMEVKAISEVSPENQSVLEGASRIWNEKNWLALFEKTASEFPESPAIVDEFGECSYKELGKNAESLAAQLIKKGVSKGDKILLNVGRSREFITGMLATMKLGCVYIPLDEQSSTERMSFIAKDSQASWSLSYQAIPGLENLNPTEWRKDLELGIVEEISEKDLVYIIYTSGTTGTPKGVQVAHEALNNYVFALRDQILDIEQIKSFAHVSSLQADLGNTSIFEALGFGKTLLLPPQESLLDPLLLGSFFRKYPADAIKIVPSHLRAMQSVLADILPKKLLICGGEALRSEWVKTWTEVGGSSMQIMNHYGPTETTIGVLIHTVDSTEDHVEVPLGKPLANVKVCIVDADLTVLPFGVQGEICLGGNQISSGYVNNDEKSAKAFIQINGISYYRTGDRGFINENGQVVFKGRRDGQVKINGFRMELKEVEYLLQNQEEVQHAVAFVDEINGMKSLFVAIVSNGEKDCQSILAKLGPHLPSSVKPNIKWVDEIPVTRNGKADIEALKAMEHTTISTSDIQPRDWMEIQILEVFQETFPHVHVNIQDSFFDLGGHSLLAIQMMSAINQKLNTQLHVNVLFNHQSVVELAKVAREIDAREIHGNLISLVQNEGKNEHVWIHPAGGNVMCYYPIATSNKTGSTKAFMSYQLSDEVRSISEMASAYVKELIAQHTNTKVLAGWSMGALIAHEMACQLSKSGTPMPLVLVDQPPTQTGAPKHVSYNERLRTYLHKVHVFTDHQFDHALALEEEVNYEVILNEFIRVQLVPSDTPLQNFKQFLDILVRHNEMVSGYVPKVYDGPVLLLKASENLLEGQISIREYEQEDLGWGNYCSNLTLVTIPGNHITMMNAQNAPAMLEVISNWLDSLKK